MLPEGWKNTKLISLCEKISDGIHTTPDYDENSDIFFVNGNNIQADGLKFFENTKKVSKRDYEKYKKEIGSNTILMSINGTIGNTCLYNNERVVLGKSACYLNAKKNTDLIFILHSLRSSHLQNYFLSELTGTTIRNLSLKTIKNSNILLPPLPEQKKIAAILSTWDRAIEETEKLLANSQQQKKALMQQLLTGKKRLPEFTGEWPFTALRHALREEKTPPTKNPQNIELLTVKLHHKGTIPSGKYPRPSERGRTYHIRHSGTLIIGRQNLHNGGIAIVSDDCNGLIASNAISSFSSQGDYNILFLYFLMCTDTFMHKVDTLTGGTGQKEVSNKDLFSIKWRIPPLPEQKAIATILTTADEEIAAIESDLARLHDEKKALMQQLLTGKRRVKVDQEISDTGL